LIQSFVKFKAANSVLAFWSYSWLYLFFIVYLALGYHNPIVLLLFWIEQTIELVAGLMLAPVRIKAVWTIWDIFRLLSMAIYIVANFGWPANTYLITISLTILNFFAWIGVCKFLRRVSGVREFITLISVSLTKMIYFGIIIIIFLLGFATSLRIKPQELHSPDHIGGVSIGRSIVNQYKLVFGDFGPWDDFEDSDTGPDGLDTVFFILITITVTMILFNLIVSIFTDAYGDLKEIRVAVDIEQLNEIQCDVEFHIRFMRHFWNAVLPCRKKIDKKS